MEYRIDHGNQFENSYSREEVQAFINNGQLNARTKVWKAEWQEWRSLSETDFDLSQLDSSPLSFLPQNLPLSIRPFLALMDNGHFYRKPFAWLYLAIGIINVLFPFYILYEAITRGISNNSGKFIFVFFVLWVVIAFASWISFQLWLDRKEKLSANSNQEDEFVATPVFAHFFQTLGEWIGCWIAIVGFFAALFVTLVLGDEGGYFGYMIGLPFLKTGFAFAILMPLYGFLTILITRFLAEQFRALATIANNTRKK